MHCQGMTSQALSKAKLVFYYYPNIRYYIKPPTPLGNSQAQEHNIVGSRIIHRIYIDMSSLLTLWRQEMKQK